MQRYYLYLIRHGLTQANREGRYAGITDLPLSQEGKNEILKKRETWENKKIERVYSSPLKRAEETAKILFPGFPLFKLEFLKEYDFGDFEMKRIEDLKENIDFIRFVQSGGKVAPPHAEETQVQFMERIKLAFEEILQDIMQKGILNSALIGHAGMISTWLALYAVPKKPSTEWKMNAGEGYQIAITPQLWMQGQIVEAVGKI